MKILHVSRSDGGGGAQRASLRLHRAMLGAGMPSRMLVVDRKSDDPTVTGPSSLAARLWGMIRPRLVETPLKGLDGQPPWATRSFNLLPTGMHRVINASDADIVHLHWVGNETISIREIGRIEKPIVWTLRDMWPFSGSLHYEAIDAETRQRAGYPPLPMTRRTIAPLDLDRWTHRRKLSAWRDLDLHIVGLSHWIAEAARQSELFGHRPVTRIPNTIDLERFHPRNRATARQIIGLPEDARIILFGAVGGGRDPRKGATLLYRALDEVWQALAPDERARTMAVLYGSSVGRADGEGMPVRALGRFEDDASLALLHAAADLFVAPSVQENLPNTVIEAAACGRPAIAFDIGGMPDVIRHGETGFLVPLGDVSALARHLRDMLVDDGLRERLGHGARRHAEASFAPQHVLPAYAALYADVLAARGRAAHKW